MEGLTLRPLTRSDAGAVVEIELASEAAEPVEHYTDQAEILEEMDRSEVDLQNGSVAAVVGGVVIGYGIAFPPARPIAEWVAHLSVAVLPGFRRRGVGRALLERLVDQAAVRHEADHPDLPGVVQLWLSQGRGSAFGFAAAAGFVPRRYFFDMAAQLAEVPPAAQDVDGFVLRGWTPADDEGTRLAYNDSFADHWGSTPSDPDRWQDMFTGSAFFRPEFSRVAVQDDRVVGFVLVDEFESETTARGYRSGYIDRVGTVRTARGRGVASALLAGSLQRLAESGCRTAELGVDADSPTAAGRIYERLGFQVVRRNDVVGRKI